MKKALIVSLSLHVITFAAIAAFAIKRYYFNHRPVAASPSEWSVKWNQQKNDLYNAVPINRGDIVFIGDSHIERFLLNDFYPGKTIRNRGIGSNTTDQVIDRLPAILLHKPAEVYILAGINDLAMRRPVDSVFNNIVKITKMVMSADAAPHIISLLPSRGADAALNDAAVKLNKKLVQYCINGGPVYIDMFTPLEKSGELDKDLTSDDTHLNGKGYLIFKKVLDRYMN